VPSPPRTDSARPPKPRPGRASGPLTSRSLTRRSLAGLALALTGMLAAAGCTGGAGATAGPAAQGTASPRPASAGTDQGTQNSGGSPLGSPASPTAPSGAPSGTATSGQQDGQGQQGQNGPAGRHTTGARPLAGKTVGIDPGHNGGNFSHPADLARQIWNGRAMEDCDTTGTETNAGYTEAAFTLRVARFLRQDLRRAGARVVMTRHTNTGVGPCVDQRSRILNRGRAQVSIDIHGDGGPAGGRGFAVLLPVADGPNNHVIRSSARFGRVMKRAFLAGTRMPISSYDGINGFAPRTDLAGLNLTTMPKVLIEVGNMRNATDAGMMITTRFQRRAAHAMAAAIITFLTHR
jgi:N-acetylmuramoyl-L-alanine amidase